MIAIWNLFLNNTSNEYTLQVVYDTNGFYRKYHRIITSILAIYDTTVPPYSYTGSGNIDITDDQISLSFSLGVNGEVFLNTGNYDGAVFEMSSATEIFICLQNTVHGGAPIAQFYSSTKVCTFHGDCQIPNMYNKTFVDILVAGIYNDTHTKTDRLNTKCIYKPS